MAAFQSGFVISPRGLPPGPVLHHHQGLAVKFLEDQVGRSCAKDSAPLKRNEKRSYSFRCRNLLREHQSPITRDAFRNAKKEKATDREEIDIKPVGRQLLKESKHEESDGQDILASRTRVASLRGWNKGGSAQSEIKYTDNVKQWKKLFSNSAFFSKKSFRELGCNDEIIESLRSQHIQKPSNIQALAFPSIILGKSCIVADQSGSGKTLAYLLPVIQRLKQEELQGLGKSLPQSPRVIILVPTAELACQVLANCRAVSKSGVPFRSMVATGGFRQKTQLESLQQEMDVLIVTPGRLMFLMRAGLLHLNNLRCVVLDEVDILFTDEDYDPALQILISSSPVTTQYLFVTATLPMDIYNKLVEVFPDCEVIMGPGVHRTSPNLEEILVDCSGDEGSEKSPDAAFSNKKSALLQLVEESPAKKMIIFCNKIETCRKVENILKRLDRNGTHQTVFSFHAALAQEVRVANMKEFCSSEMNDDKSLFLVCTDRASRGIDFSEVGQIVLFDFPRDPSEYVRRVGRTARGPGGKGKAFIFVVGKQVSLARRIIERNRRGHPVHDVPTAF